VDDVDNPWISSISTRIYPPSMDIYPDASMVVPTLLHGLLAIIPANHRLL